MPNIDTYLNSIMIAELGEDVRESIHDAIEAINDAVDDGITEAAAMVGAPLVASTAAGMTDTDKVYIYTGTETGYTAGNWYYWNGTEWTSGGIYNTSDAVDGLAQTVESLEDDVSDIQDEIGDLANLNTTNKSDLVSAINETLNSLIPDPSLSVQGLAADAKAVGDAVENLDIKTGDLTELHTNEKQDLVSAINDAMENSGADGLLYENSRLYLTRDGVVVSDPVTIVSGGGEGGSDNEAVITVANETGWLSKTISESEQCELTVSWSSVEGEYATGDGAMTIRVNGIVKVQQTIQQGTVSINVREYLTSGSNVVRVTIADVYGNSRSLSFSISLVALSISATAFEISNASATYSSSVQFAYVPVGAVAKNVVFILDGLIIGTQEVTTSGRQQTFTIPSQNHGAHSFEVYFTATVNGSTVTSNHLYFELIFVAAGDTTPIIASPFRASGATQYYTLSIPYTVFTPDSATSEVTFTATVVDENEETTVYDLGSRTVGRTQQTFTYTPTKVGALTLAIASGGVTKTFTLSVARLNIDVEAETDSLELYLSAEGRSNAEARPGTWEFNNISCTFTDFNFVSDGWQLDEESSTCLKVSGKARLTIPFHIFGSDFKSTGKTIEFDFSTSDVMNYDSTIVSCFADGKGLKISPQSVSLASEATSISTQYKEEEHVRIAFVIEKTSEHRLIYTYINGICSGIVQYPAGDDFEQTNPAYISVGSDDCTINLYTIRVYNNSLTRYQILDNWIADTPDGATMLARYNRNNVYDEYGEIVINNLPSNLPYLIIESASLPQYKGDKKTISGSFTNPIDPTKSFTFPSASCDVQGTSSAGYPRKNYKIKFSSFINEDGEESSKYYLRGANESLPTNVFCFKADYASSEGANNVELVRLYNDACPFETEAQDGNPLVRQGIDGIPIVIFWSNTATGTISFLGKYNFNFDKSSKVFGFDDGDESWETKDNSNDWALFKRANYEGTGWLSAFEARHPDTDPEYTDPTKLSAMAKWVNSTDRAAATDEALASPVTYEDVTYTVDSAEYRLAKFRNELTNYFHKDDTLFYYLFTELFLMVDSRVKNSFPTIYASHDGAKWCWLPYDMDTAIGINNEGALAFDYSLEDTDMVSPTAGVYNGYQTVMWNNVRDAFPKELEKLYQDVRAEGVISYDEIESRFEEHQNTWNEAIFNEDAYFKYIRPFIEDGENNLFMCLGSKAEQRKWWLYNRFRYIDSKYTAGLATATTLQMRVYQKSDLAVTPYADIYAGALFDSNLVKAKAPRGQETVLESPATWNPGGSDAVLRIYSADQIKSLGDLSGFYIGQASFAAATKLQEIKLGDADSNYSNANLVEVTFGTNNLLQSVDIRNCPNLTTNLDFSHCENLKVIHLEGTSVTGVTLADGGAVEELYLPDTVTNLTLKNLKNLDTFELNDFSNLTTVWLENVDLIMDETKDIVLGMNDGGRIRITGIDWETESKEEFSALISKLDTCRGLDETGANVSTAQITGSIHTTMASTATLRTAQEKYPYVTFSADEEYNMVKKYLEDNYIDTEDFNSAALYIRALHRNRPGGVNGLTGDVVMPNFRAVGSGSFSSAKMRSFTSTYSGTDGYIDSTGFSGSNNLESVSMTGIKEVWGSAFSGCRALKNVYLPDVESMPRDNTFLNCTSLEVIKLPSLVATAYANDFTNCTSLKYIYLPGLTKFNNGHQTGFLCGGCTAFKGLVLSGSSVVPLTYTRELTYFYDGTLPNAYIYVPKALISSYQVATNWATVYANRSDIFRGIEDYSVDGTVDGDIDDDIA